jgi:hypothetical protein
MRIEKFLSSQLPMLLFHNYRELENTSNRDIDFSRTHLNYRLSPENESSGSSGDLDYFKFRISQLHCHNRADVKKVCGAIVTAPRDLNPMDNTRFFQEVYNFLSSRYGGKNEENVVSAVVHLDESTPHLHYLWVPVAAINFKKSKNYNGKTERICAKEVIHRKELIALHPALQKHMDKSGIKCSIITGTTKGRSRPMQQYKREAAQREYEHERQRGVFINRDR